MFETAAQAFWLAFVTSALLSWPVLTLLRRMKSESVISPYAPDGHQQKKGTPNMGGIFVVIAVLIALTAAGFLGSQTGLCVIILVVGFALIGFLDDFVVPKATSKRGLGWLPKLLLEFAVASAIPLLLGWEPSNLLAAFFVVFFANAVNFADGLDALAGSLLIFAAIPFLVFSASNGGGLPLLSISAAMGALLPFLALNAPPAKIFMGDVGSLPLGALFGFWFVSAPWDARPWPWIASLVFSLELLLVPIQIAAVKTIKRRVFPSTPIHHSFEVLGWPESRVLWTFIIAQLTLSAAALTEMIA